MNHTDRYSPCIGICSSTNCGDDICIGCGRTAQEVINWNQMAEEEKKEVWTRLLGDK